MKILTGISSFLLASSFFLTASAQSTTGNQPALNKKEALEDIQSKYSDYKKIALKIWDFAEVGYKEQKSSDLLQKTLKASGFTVSGGVAEIPTAFVATYGSGKPVIGILAEFDALPGLQQDSVADKHSTSGKNSGHGCGHHLFGTASVAAGIELKKLMLEKHLKGTVIVYGCPAEEGGGGKVYMVRAGLFKDVDVVLHWHPAAENAVLYATTMAVTAAKFRFYGISAHAAAAPDKGRSALDAVESMDYMVNMMREHMPSDARIHYIITNGGKAPNVVPDFAESYYMVRHYSRSIDKELFERVVNAAKGAALGTDTRMEYELIDGDHDILPNKTLAIAMKKNLDQVGGVSYSARDLEFAKKIQASFPYKVPAIETAGTIDPLPEKAALGGASSDVGDVSYNVPTIGLGAATWVPGTSPHSWQATACGATDIGIKGMIVAAKTLALTGLDLLTDPSLIEQAKAEFELARGPEFVYKPLIGDRKPPLDYRNPSK